MNRPRKPLWSDGLALWPNHFDAQDRYHERLLATRLRALTPYDWGVLDLDLDLQALAAGEVRISRLDAILPDGTPIVVGDANGDVLLPRSIDDLARAERLDVYVAIAPEEDGSPNVDLAHGNGQHASRYARVEATSRDLASGKVEKTIPWLRHNLELVFEHAVSERRALLRVSELVRSTAGAWIVRPSFVPPLLRISASPFLVEGFERVLRAMNAKQQAISNTRRQRHAAAIEFQAADAPRFWLLDALNTSIPLFAEIVDKAASTTPKEAHIALAQLIGRLSTFRPDAQVADIPKLNYLALGEVFAPMFDRARDLLDVVIAERFVEVPLTAHPNHYFTGELRDVELLSCDFFLAVSSSGVNETELREVVLNLMKMSSSDVLGQLLNVAAQGVEVAIEHHPPAALPVKPGVLFFRIDRSCEHWRGIAKSGSLSMFLPARGAQAALYAVDSSTLQ